MRVKSKANQAFSLIEAIIYIGIISMILSVLGVAFREEIFLNAKINDQIEMTNNGQFALNKIIWYVQNAESINYPLPGENRNELSVNIADPEANPVIFAIENNVLKIKQDADQAIPLTNARIKAKQIVFSNFAFPSQNGAIQIVLTLESTSTLWNNQPIVLQTSAQIGE
jgi:type II secretory pathway pseudopilin PulG